MLKIGGTEQAVVLFGESGDINGPWGLSSFDRWFLSSVVQDYGSADDGMPSAIVSLTKASLQDSIAGHCRRQKTLPLGKELVGIGGTEQAVLF